MHADILLAAARRHADAEAIVWRDETYSYAWLLDEVANCTRRFDDAALASGTVVALDADFSPWSVAALIALIGRGAIVVPITQVGRARREELFDIAEVEVVVALQRDVMTIERRDAPMRHHELLEGLRERGNPGLILFSSGSTGRSKAVVHDFAPLLEKFAMSRATRRMLAFLLFDHIGGVNTLLYALSNGGTIITTDDRSPRVVCAVIERHRVEVLPATPTFLHLLLLSEVHLHADLSSLQLITYGTEVMPELTLKRLHEAFPQIELLQTYGLSEVGILRSKSRSSDSLWMRIGGEGFETRVRNGLLEIKAKSAMLGYLNAPSPFTEDGWFMTGDAVEQDGDYVRILGRASELINVGGEKVFPAEVEMALESIAGVQEAVVYSEPSALTGHSVVARVKLENDESLRDFRVRMRKALQGRLAPYKIPQKVVLSDEAMHNERFKKLRR